MMEPGFGSGEQALLTLAAAIADGDEAWLRTSVAAVLSSGVAPAWVDELILQSLLTVGWPRALVAAAAWRSVAPLDPDSIDDTDYADHAEWTRRGEATCALIYGNYYRKLRDNVRALHPALESWMITEGYGRTLSRPGFPVRERELCTVVQTAVLRTPRQLHSHVLGALHAGATLADVEAALDTVRPRLSVDAWADAAGVIDRVRSGGVR